MPPFKIRADYRPTGDQPEAIEELARGLEGGLKHQTLLGVTGSGKTFTMAGVIEKVQRPTLVIAHNKTLAAQLATEFQDYFPDNSAQYFVSYYDYYQPEAYVPQSDTYIEKESDINDEIDRLRHAATRSLLTRRDTVIVASVSVHIWPGVSGRVPERGPERSQGAGSRAQEDRTPPGRHVLRAQ